MPWEDAVDRVRNYPLREHAADAIDRIRPMSQRALAACTVSSASAAALTTFAAILAFTAGGSAARGCLPTLLHGRVGPPCLQVQGAPARSSFFRGFSPRRPLFMRRKAGNPHAASFERWHARRASRAPRSPN